MWANEINAVIMLQLITATQLTHFRYCEMVLLKKNAITHFKLTE